MHKKVSIVDNFFKKIEASQHKNWRTENVLIWKITINLQEGGGDLGLNTYPSPLEIPFLVHSSLAIEKPPAPSSPKSLHEWLWIFSRTTQKKCLKREFLKEAKSQ